MRRPGLRFKIWKLMTAVAVAALVLTPFAWSSPESRLPLLVAVLTVAAMLLIVASPLLLDLLEGGQRRRGPRTAKTAPLPRSLGFFTFSPPPHRRKPSEP
jgi:hypothetical protein